MPTELPLWLERLPPSLERPLGYLRVDFAPRPRQPSTAALMAATVVSIAGSLAADALLVMLGKKLFPATAHYSHFQFSDYSKLTVIGVLIACAAWPVVTRISSSPRWLFFRQAIAVTLVLLLPDLYIWYQGQPAQGVGVLVVMHLAIALVTYNALVHIARIGEPEPAGYDGAYAHQPGGSRPGGPREAAPWDPRYPSRAGHHDYYEDYYRSPLDAGRRDTQPASSGSRRDYYADYYRDSLEAGRRDMRPAPGGRREYRGPWEPKQDARSAHSRHRDEADPWT